MTEAVAEEDRKLITLARSALARSSATTAAAVRDDTGRTYVGVDVALPSFSLGALALCVAQAVAGGSTGLERAAVVTADPGAELDLGPVADLGGEGVAVLVADRRGAVLRTVGS